MPNDPAERVAQELAEWLELRSTQVANAVLESVYRPRVVEPTTAETVAYFRPLLVNPDGTRNEAGKQFIIHGGVNPLTGKPGPAYGAEGYETIAKSVAKSITAEKDAILAEASDQLGEVMPSQR